MFRKGFKILISLILISIISGTLYILNDEKFYPEFWLQKKLENIEPSDKPKIKNNQEVVRYKMYYDNFIDLTIELTESNLDIIRNSWFIKANPQKAKFYTFKLEPDEFEQIKEEVLKNWKESKIVEVDDHLNGLHHTVEWTNNEQELKIAYYNVVPEKEFKAFKTKILELTKKKIK